MSASSHTPRLRVVEAGPLALVEDGGRFGVRHLGVTQGGAADLLSLWGANALLGNALDAPVLEIVMGGLTLAVEQDGWLALTGADLGARLDDRPLEPGSRFAVHEGQQLSFATPVCGMRACLSLPGGVSARPVLGSVACVMREQLGGLNGRGAPLAIDDVIEAAGHDGERPEADRLPAALSHDWRVEIAALAAISGAQIADFTGESVYQAFNREWEVDQRADRMGIRLLGPELVCRRERMISEPIPQGAIQVPADGQPIVLGVERQTIGGYPRLGALTPLAASRLAQCAPGECIRLRAVSACQARRDQLALRERLSGWRDGSLSE